MTDDKNFVRLLHRQECTRRPIYRSARQHFVKYMKNVEEIDGVSASCCVFCLDISSRSDWCVFGNGGSDICIMDLHFHKPIATFSAHSEMVTDVITLDDETRTFYTASLDRTICLWKGNERLQRLSEHDDWIRCLALNESRNTLLSGCVTSRVYGWDVSTGLVKYHFTLPASEAKLNSVNSLSFLHQNDNFCVGSRDGIVRYYDMYVRRYIPHATSDVTDRIGEQFSPSDMYFYTNGRDDSVRYWDARMNRLEIGQEVYCFNEHKCKDYKVGACLFGGGQFIAVGSECGGCYIYDTKNGNLAKILRNHSSVLHIVKTPSLDSYSLLTSSIDSSQVSISEPSLNGKCTLESRRGSETMGEREATIFHVLGSVMREKGDDVLSMFHKYNFTLSGDYSSFVRDVVEGGDREDISQLNLFLQSMYQAYATSITRPQNQ